MEQLLRNDANLLLQQLLKPLLSADQGAAGQDAHPASRPDQLLRAAVTKISSKANELMLRSARSEVGSAPAPIASDMQHERMYFLLLAMAIAEPGLWSTLQQNFFREPPAPAAATSSSSVFGNAKSRKQQKGVSAMPSGAMIVVPGVGSVPFSRVLQFVQYMSRVLNLQVVLDNHHSLTTNPAGDGAQQKNKLQSSTALHTSDHVAKMRDDGDAAKNAARGPAATSAPSTSSYLFTEEMLTLLVVQHKKADDDDDQRRSTEDDRRQKRPRQVNAKVKVGRSGVINRPTDRDGDDDDDSVGEEVDGAADEAVKGVYASGIFLGCNWVELGEKLLRTQRKHRSLALAVPPTALYPSSRTTRPRRDHSPNAERGDDDVDEEVDDNQAVINTSAGDDGDGGGVEDTDEARLDLGAPVYLGELPIPWDVGDSPELNLQRKTSHCGQHVLRSEWYAPVLTSQLLTARFVFAMRQIRDCVIKRDACVREVFLSPDRQDDGDGGTKMGDGSIESSLDKYCDVAADVLGGSWKSKACLVCSRLLAQRSVAPQASLTATGRKLDDTDGKLLITTFSNVSSEVFEMKAGARSKVTSEADTLIRDEDEISVRTAMERTVASVLMTWLLPFCDKRSLDDMCRRSLLDKTCRRLELAAWTVATCTDLIPHGLTTRDRLVQCEGPCGRWIHEHCIFPPQSELSHPFYCHGCRLRRGQRKEASRLCEAPRDVKIVAL